MAETPQKPKPDQRQYYRIQYPVQERPFFECQGRKYLILDISEKGLAVRIDGADPITQSTAALTGKIAFKCGEIVTITGKVLRFENGILILTLQPGVPYAIVMKEQRFLLQRYGHLKK
ncbi:MAG: hypothetical protein NTV34_01755 [Proteobacteria bacterium]|nr:hypothetical protein [Pseudomonadota bacterium]